MLQTLGLKFEILEASDRIGGRIFTHCFNGKAGIEAPVGDPARYDYIDMGAMRFQISASCSVSSTSLRKWGSRIFR
ncbi:hypothetical protein FRB94_013457 [Tulasnella sp. JGI-2019a]|nr:hypothetical protein FRB94_013457 [Tulasnella sp. JGI-2019a]KAG9032716.1 hypothetical protein FRB95_001052 [Tulasnella sp. JGI-2019a]